MRGWLPFRSKVFFKYFLSYLFIFSIPLIILGALIYYNAVVSLRAEIEQAHLNQLQQVKDNTDLRITELNQIAARMAYDSRLTPYMVRNGGYEAREAIEELVKYKLNSAILEEVFMYFRGDPTIYSSSGSFSMNLLTGQMYRFEAWDAKQLASDLNTVSQPTIRPAETVRLSNGGAQRLLTYLYPIKPGNPFHYGTVMFLIRESVFTGMIDNILGNFEGNVYILDEQYQVLASKNVGGELTFTEDLQSIVRQSNTGIRTLRVGQQDYALVSVTSEVSGWTWLTLIPTSQFFERVGKVQTFVIAVVLSVLLFGLGLATFLSLVSYRPIRALTEAIKDRWGAGVGVGIGIEKNRRANELDHIRDTIGQVFDSHEGLLQEIDAQRPLVRDQLLLNLLKGSYDTLASVEEVLAAHKLEWHRSHFFAVYVSFGEAAGSRETSRLRETVLEQLESFAMDDVIAYGLELIHDHAIALAVSLRERPADERAIREQVAAALLQNVPAAGRPTLTMGIGKLYDDMLLLNRSFVEASAAMEYRLSHRGNVIFFEDIMKFQDQTTWYPLEEQVKFVQSLKQGDRIVASETLQHMIEGIANQGQSILLLKCMSMDVVNTVFKTITEMNLKSLYPEMKSLLDFQTLDELQSSLVQLVEHICEAVEQSREHSSHALRGQIITYIQEHYRSNDFSLEQVAEQFRLSVSYLSRFIKEQTGGNFIDYVTELRFDEVKQQLRATEKPVKEIILEVGYLDVPSFNRKFKKLEGITPGQYRKLYGGVGTDA
jgi:two-component system response regulator YesN